MIDIELQSDASNRISVSEISFGTVKGRLDVTPTLQSGEGVAPRLDTSAAKVEFQSEMMRRDNYGDSATDAAGAIAPIVVGEGLKPKAPETLKTLGALPDVEAVTTITQAADRTIEFSAKQLQKKYKHAGAFGITEDYNPANAARFQTAIEQHVSNPATKVIEGTYRKTIKVTHFVDSSTGIDVLRDESGQFHSAWKLNAEQLRNVLTRGSL